MPAPVIPVWDSNGTNVTTSTGGHQTDGYALNEIPTSGELNYQLRQLYLCLNYIKSLGLLGTTTTVNMTLANTDDVDLTGLSDVYHLRCNTTTPPGELTGLDVGQVDQRRVLLTCVGTVVLTLLHENAGSSAINRFTLTGGTSRVVPVGGSVEIVYDGTSQRWRVLD